MRTLTTDVVVVGAGASGLVAAMVARRLGREVVVVEASGEVGGSTTAAGGMLWLPCNEAMTKLGASDTPEDAAAYFEAVLGATTEASTAERRAAFLDTAPRLAKWFEQSKLGMTAVRNQADYFDSLPGYRRQGRALIAPPLDRRILGPWVEHVRVSEEPSRGLAVRSPGEVLAVARAFASRLFTTDRNVAAGGAALVTQLLNRALGMGVAIWTDAPMTDLLDDGGTVTGIRLTRAEEEIELVANEGVILAASGFEANQDEREEHLPLPTSTEWSLGSARSTGMPMAAARRLGAAVAAMGEAWWVPVMLADGEAFPVDDERRLPGAILVDQAGNRFVDEAGPPFKVGKAMYDRNRSVRAVPCFLIMDARHRAHYELGPWLPGTASRSALDSGELVKAASLNDLAATLGIDRPGLLGTVVRFNGFAAKGKDLDFRRGDTAYERDRGDATKRRNPCLGRIDKAPYWAVKVYPGDRGTKGGVLIDEKSRVLRPDGTPIVGLYASGGTAASMLKQTAPAEGSSLAVACVEAFRAALHLCDQLDADTPEATA